MSVVDRFRYEAAAARLLGLRVRIPREAWMPVSCERCQEQIPPTGRSLVQGNPTESIAECERASTPTISRFTGVRNTKEREDMNTY